MDRMCQLNVCIDFNVSIDSNVYIGSYVSTGPSVSYGPLHWTIIKVVTKLLVLQLGLMDVQWRWSQWTCTLDTLKIDPMFPLDLMDMDGLNIQWTMCPVGI